jgi:hypothetical protein
MSPDRIAASLTDLARICLEHAKTAQTPSAVFLRMARDYQCRASLSGRSIPALRGEGYPRCKSLGSWRRSAALRGRCKRTEGPSCKVQAPHPAEADTNPKTAVSRFEPSPAVRLRPEQP